VCRRKTEEQEEDNQNEGMMKKTATAGPKTRDHFQTGGFRAVSAWC
jgi:hypothetical protein